MNSNLGRNRIFTGLPPQNRYNQNLYQVVNHPSSSYPAFKLNTVLNTSSTHPQHQERNFIFPQQNSNYPQASSSSFQNIYHSQAHQSDRNFQNTVKVPVPPTPPPVPERTTRGKKECQCQCARLLCMSDNSHDVVFFQTSGLLQTEESVTVTFHSKSGRLFVESKSGQAEIIYKSGTPYMDTLKPKNKPQEQIITNVSSDHELALALQEEEFANNNVRRQLGNDVPKHTFRPPFPTPMTVMNNVMPQQPIVEKSNEIARPISINRNSSIPRVCQPSRSVLNADITASFPSEPNMASSFQSQSFGNECNYPPHLPHPISAPQFQISQNVSAPLFIETGNEMSETVGKVIEDWDTTRMPPPHHHGSAPWTGSRQPTVFVPRQESVHNVSDEKERDVEQRFDSVFSKIKCTSHYTLTGGIPHIPMENRKTANSIKSESITKIAENDEDDISLRHTLYEASEDTPAGRARRLFLPETFDDNDDVISRAPTPISDYEQMGVPTGEMFDGDGIYDPNRRVVYGLNIDIRPCNTGNEYEVILLTMHRGFQTLRVPHDAMTPDLKKALLLRFTEGEDCRLAPATRADPKMNLIGVKLRHGKRLEIRVTAVCSYVEDYSRGRLFMWTDYAGFISLSSIEVTKWARQRSMREQVLFGPLRLLTLSLKAELSINDNRPLGFPRFEVVGVEPMMEENEGAAPTPSYMWPKRTFRFDDLQLVPGIDLDNSIARGDEMELRSKSNEKISVFFKSIVCVSTHILNNTRCLLSAIAVPRIINEHQIGYQALIVGPLKVLAVVTSDRILNFRPQTTSINFRPSYEHLRELCQLHRKNDEDEPVYGRTSRARSSSPTGCRAVENFERATELF